MQGGGGYAIDSKERKNARPRYTQKKKKITHLRSRRDELYAVHVPHQISDGPVMPPLVREFGERNTLGAPPRDFVHVNRTDVVS